MKQSGRVEFEHDHCVETQKLDAALAAKTSGRPTPKGYQFSSLLTFTLFTAVLSQNGSKQHIKIDQIPDL